MVCLKAFLGFRFFSPSREAVSINALPSEELVRRIRSAGNISSVVVLMISPTWTWLQLVSMNFPFLNIYVTVS